MPCLGPSRSDSAGLSYNGLPDLGGVPPITLTKDSDNRELEAHSPWLGRQDLDHHVIRTDVGVPDMAILLDHAPLSEFLYVFRNRLGIGAAHNLSELAASFLKNVASFF